MPDYRRQGRAEIQPDGAHFTPPADCADMSTPANVDIPRKTLPGDGVRFSTVPQSRDEDAGVLGLIAQRKREVPAASCPEDTWLERALPRPAASTQTPASTWGPAREAGVKELQAEGLNGNQNPENKCDFAGSPALNCKRVGAERCKTSLGAVQSVPNRGLRLPEEDSRPSVPGSDRSGQLVHLDPSKHSQRRLSGPRDGAGPSGARHNGWRSASTGARHGGLPSHPQQAPARPAPPPPSATR